MTDWVLGIVGGSGLYQLDGLDDIRHQRVETPWGSPSGELIRGRLNGVELVFLARHGKGHRLSPSAINYRANIHALKRAGVTDVLSFSACGSLREELSPGTFVIVDQYVDRTFAREKSFFGPGCVAHVPMADPVCKRLSGLAADGARAAGVDKVVEGGTYLAMEGPQFSTRAESHLYRAWGLDVIGMTNMPEAKLAREAELPYASVCMVTDYDCWRESDSDVDINDILAVMADNTGHAHQVIAHVTREMGKAKRTPDPAGIGTVLDHAIITAPEHRDPELVAKLSTIAGRVLSRT